MKVERQNELKNAGQRASRLVLKPLKQLCGLVLRTILASFVFYAGVAAVLSYLGYPVPLLSDLGRYLRGLTELTKILS
jgi:hypothetical protein